MDKFCTEVVAFRKEHKGTKRAAIHVLAQQSGLGADGFVPNACEATAPTQHAKPYQYLLYLYKPQPTTNQTPHSNPRKPVP
jgi:hypothetical protein